VLTVSGPFRADLIRRGVPAGRIEVIHNAIDPQWGSQPTRQDRLELRASLGIAPGAKVALFVGRLSSEKDCATALRAIHRLHVAATPGPRPHFVIVGDGPQKERLVEMARALRIDRNVAFTGQVPNSSPYFAIADVVVISSLSEGSPNVLLEAMASRVPVVATAVGGIPEIVAHMESALLVRPKDDEGMARALASVLEDEALGLRLTESAYKHILAEYSPESRTRRLAGIYRCLVRQESARPVRRELRC
jgi:glycosyltransferase involved in cell wall biosynthesis